VGAFHLSVFDQHHKIISRDRGMTELRFLERFHFLERFTGLPFG